MSRRMSCSMTVDAVRDRTKTVTRRHPDTWVNLKAGDRLTLIEKGMGLPKGAKQVVLAEVEVVSAAVVPLGALSKAELEREGFPGMTADEFTLMWAKAHGFLEFARLIPDWLPTLLCRRIEWRYLDPPTGDTP